VNSWSLTSVSTYEQCQLKAKYRYHDRLEEKRSEKASRGVALHKDVENFLTGQTELLAPPLDYYQSWLQGIKQYEIYPEKVITLDRLWRPVPGNGPERYLKSILDLLLIRRAEKEEDPDYVGPAPGEPKELNIYDWKTGGIYPEHDDQKSLYSVAAFSEFPSVFSVRAIHVYFDLRKIREKTFHRDEMHQLRTAWDDRAGKFLKAIEDPEGMIPNPGFHCRFCPFSATKGGPCRF
jgi:hypothetical protein